jgi:hypothetical protein
METAMSGTGSTSVFRRGRHRKPTSTGKTVAKTVIAGAVVGAPLATAGTAQAASDGVWDRVAKCESGGNWSINSGNGFRGGLQFTSSTWRGFGGTQFASSAEKASREQQIVVAEKVLAGQGWGAWPVCSRKAHATGQPATLRTVSARTGTEAHSTARAIGTKHIKQLTRVPRSTGRHVLRPTGPTPTTRPPAAVTGQQVGSSPTPVVEVAERLRPLIGPAQPTGQHALPTALTALPIAAPAQPPNPVPTPPADQADQAAAPYAAVPHAGPAAPHAAAPHAAVPHQAKPAAPHAVAPHQAAARPAAPRADAAPRPGAPVPLIPAPRRSPEAADQGAAGTYQVKAGDTLASIARAQHVRGGWQAIYNSNKTDLPNANKIRPGQKLKLS